MNDKSKAGPLILYDLTPKRMISLDTYLMMQNEWALKLEERNKNFTRSEVLQECRELIDHLLKLNNVEVEGGL